MWFCIRLTTCPLARRADYIFCIRELRRLAFVQLLQCNLIFLLHAPPLPRHISASRSSWHAAHPSHTRHTTKVHAAAKHLGEDIVDVGTVTHSATPTRIECSHAMSIVEVSLVIIVKDFIGLFRGLEPHFGFYAVVFCNFIGMMR